MPLPSSATSMRRLPPSSRATAIWAAPASMAFSTSSFTADAGRSMTSPAAIRLAVLSSRRTILLAMGFRYFRRAVSRLHVQDAALALGTPPVAAEAAIGAHHPVAGNHQGGPVAGAGAGHRAGGGRPADNGRDLAVRSGRAVGN